MKLTEQFDHVLKLANKASIAEIEAGLHQTPRGREKARKATRSFDEAMESFRERLAEIDAML